MLSTNLSQVISQESFFLQILFRTKSHLITILIGAGRALLLAIMRAALIAAALLPITALVSAAFIFAALIAFFERCLLLALVLTALATLLALVLTLLIFTTIIIAKFSLFTLFRIALLAFLLTALFLTSALNILTNHFFDLLDILQLRCLFLLSHQFPLLLLHRGHIFPYNV